MSDEPSIQVARWPFTALVLGVSVCMTLAYLGEVDVSWALAGDEVWDGAVWRLVTSTFIHGGLMHVLFNLYWTKEFGRFIESGYGTPRTVVLFVLLALGSSAAEFVGTGTGGIGLSGVVYGYFGLLFATRGTDAAHGYRMTNQTAKLFAGWFVLCIVLTEADIWQVANLAHGAGAGIGYLIGRAQRAPRVALYFSPPALVVVGGLLASTQYMPWDYSWWWHRADVAMTTEPPDREAGFAHMLRAIEVAESDYQVGPLLEWGTREAIHRKEFDVGVDLCQRAIRVSPTPGRPKAYLAYLHGLRGERDLARKLCQEISLEDLDEYLLGIPELVENFEKPEEPDSAEEGVPVADTAGP